MKKITILMIAFVVLFSLSAVDAEARPNYQRLEADGFALSGMSAFYSGVMAGAQFSLFPIVNAPHYEAIAADAGTSSGSVAVDKWKLDIPKHRWIPSINEPKPIHD